ncbi:MAG: alkaline phosphatase D family protein [Rubrobacteraceae bacterium]
MERKLILGPLLRYTGQTDATLWVETDAACKVEVRVDGETHGSETFHVYGHHYALVRVEGLAPGGTYEYEVTLDGEKIWPEQEAARQFPPPVIRTFEPEKVFRLAFGSCRVALPNTPPYTLSADEDENGHGPDALYALARKMRREDIEKWPDALLMLGDQIYADEVSPGTREFIDSRRKEGGPPMDQVADFEEYTHLYKDAWQDPTIRWLLSTLPTAMIFDDHDVNDDWNISRDWVEMMRKKPWWQERIVGGFMSYWIYQHLGNLSPEELEEDEMYRRVRESEDASQALREFAYKADRETSGTRWSFHRDFGRTRLIVVDSRAGRVLKNGRRLMVDDKEWRWIEEKAAGDFDHLLLGTSLPFLMPPGLHHFEAWNEAVCDGAWGKSAARLGEKLRQAADLEHWSAFHESFDALTNLLEAIATGEHSGGHPPASIVLLSGDVHHGYLAKAEFGNGSRARSAVYQAVCSPLRNQLGRPERIGLGSGWTKPGEVIGKVLSRLAGVKDPSVSWRLTHEKPWFDNHVSTVELAGREARLGVDGTTDGDEKNPCLRRIFEHRLA